MTGTNPGDAGSRRRLRSVLALVGVFLFSLSLVATLAAYWNRSVALDTDSWMELAGPVIASEAFTEEMSRKLTDGVLELVGLEDLLDEAIAQLPELGPVTQTLIDLLGIPSLEEMADRLVDGVRVRLEDRLDIILRSQLVQESVTELVRRSHEAFVVIATGDLEDGGVLYVDGDRVKLNTLPLLARVTERVIGEGILGREIELRLPDLSDYPTAAAALERVANAVGFEIPDDLGQIDLMSAEKLERIQTLAKWLDRLVWLLAITTALLAILALSVSPNRRRTIVELATGALLALIVSYFLINSVIGGLQSWFLDPGIAATYEILSTQVIASIAGVWLAVAILGVLVGVSAFIAGKPEWTSRDGETTVE